MSCKACVFVLEAPATRGMGMIQSVEEAAPLPAPSECMTAERNEGKSHRSLPRAASLVCGACTRTNSLGVSISGYDKPSYRHALESSESPGSAHNCREQAKDTHICRDYAIDAQLMM